MTIEATTGNGCQATKRRKEKLLKVSDFLNQFQKHFLPPLAKKGVRYDSNEQATLKAFVGEITSRDLEDAMGFRALLEELAMLEEEKFVLGECGKREVKSKPLARQIADCKTEELEAIRKEIQGIPDRTKLIFSMLRRCEVWTSKLVAQDQLVTPTKLLPEETKKKSKINQRCFSPFIDVPSSGYFEKILPSKKEHLALGSTTTAEQEASNSSQSSISAFHRKNMCVQGCTLALPPNKHTWEAYARLAVMASLVSDDELCGCDSDHETVVPKKKRELALLECVKSPLCVHTLKHKKVKNPSLNYQYAYSPKSDLVPLWIRAQRNTQALRQLIQLFEVKKTTTNEMRTDDEDTVRLEAIFQGNTTHVRPRVTEVSEDVDRLIEWAVVNQSIFTYSHIRKEILTAPLHRQQTAGRKRQREGEDSYQNMASKKIFRDTNENPNLFELHQACQSYLLRWFARRNRSALTILFSKRIEKMPPDIGCLVNNRGVSQAKVLRKAEVPDLVQQDMLDINNGTSHPEDRTLSRIDRRLFIKDRYSGTSKITCLSQVSTLLKTFSDACPENQKSHKKLIDAARKDLKNLFETFYPTTIDEKSLEDGYRAASRLVDVPQGHISSSMSDFIKNTPAPWVEKCCKCNKAGPADLRICFSCEKGFHEECSGSGSTTITLKHFISSFQPLLDFFKLKRPKNMDVPDFSKSEDQWVEKTIHIERKISDGTVKKLGISFDHTEDCSNALETIESDAFSLLEFIRSEGSDTEGRNLLLAARIRHKGCLVKDVHEGLSGGKAGLQAGDVIIGLEILKYAYAKDELKYGGKRKFDFSGLTSKERLALLKVQSLQLNLIVLRPPINIIKIATEWYNSTKRINKCILDVVRGINTVRPWYCGSCVRSGSEEQSKSVFSEARYCRAVIRRIGMESFAQPFTEGAETSQSGYFCLRRLDAMMTHIMGVESKDKFYDLAPDSFLAPSPVSSSLQRLPWAPSALEGRPMELLCKAMKTLVDSEFPGKGHINTQRSALLRHFLLAFCSYCVGSTVKSKHYSQLIGPPKIFQYSRAPFFASFSPSRTPYQQIGAVDRVEVEKAGKAMIEYLRNASLVGKTFLVLPSDPLVEHVSKIVHIYHENRPVEFVVASYLPSNHHDEVVRGRQKEQYDQFSGNDGIYHLLPVISSQQQHFLLERCKMRNEDAGENFGSSWMSLDVLNLQGVARYSPTALRCKMHESSEIRLAIDHATVQKVCTASSISPHLLGQVSSQFKIDLTKSSSPSIDLALEIEDKLLETLLKGDLAGGTLRELLDIDENCDRIDTVGCHEGRSNWKIMRREENSESLKFGSSHLVRGFLPINPMEASWNILKVQNIPENAYKLYYSDFFFSDERSKQDLLKALHPPQLSPFRGSQRGSMRIFTLSNREPNLGVTDMFGWGFEIMRWAKEHILRVGRVRHDSPAYRSGLRTHDIIESINGVRFSQFLDISSMVCSILGAPNVRIRLPRNVDRFDEISILLWTIKSAKIRRCSTTLFVQRPSAVDNRDARSGMSTSRPELPIQLLRQRTSGIVASQRNLEFNRGGGENRPLPSPRVGNSRSITSTQHPHQRPVAPQISTVSNMGGRQNSLPPSHHTRTINPGPPSQHAPQRPVAPRRTIALNRANGQNVSSRFVNPDAVRKIASLIQAIRRTSTNRHPVRHIDMYRAAKHGTILTALEVAVFLACLDNRTWKLGARLLMPRYDLPTIQEQIRIIFSWQAEQLLTIPTVEGKYFQTIVDLDYERMTCKTYPETGPIILREQKDGATYEYTAPVRALPIDRQIEILFDADQKRQKHLNHHHHHQQQQQQQQQQHQYQYQYQQWNYSQPSPQGQQLLLNHHMSYPNQDRNNGYSNNYQHERNDQERGYDHNGSQVPPQGSVNSGNQGRESRQSGEVQNNDNFVNLVDDEFEPIIETDEPLLLVMNEMNHQGEDDVNQQNGSVGNFSWRIRGGGNSDADETNDSTNGNYLYLCDVPRNQWKGIAVYTFVQTTSKGSVCDDTLLVGFARNCIDADIRDEEIPDKVEIEAYYLSGTGYFEQAKMVQSESDEVWVVNIDDDCEEARVIAKLGSQKKLPGDYKEEFQRATLRKTASDNQQEEQEQPEETAVLDGPQDGDRSHTATPNVQDANRQDIRREPSNTVGMSCADSLRLESDPSCYNYTCEERSLGIKPSVENGKRCHECSLCSLPFERFGNKKQTLGCRLMSDVCLVEDASSDTSMPGRLGEAKSLLLKIAALVPASMKVPQRSVDVPLWEDPLSSFRIFDTNTNYRLWKDFVKECTCQDMLAQAFLCLVASIQRSKLPAWWSRKDSGWSTPYTIMGLDLSALYLHIYVLDAALSDIIAQSLNETPAKKSNDAAEGQRMNQYWERSIVLGYKAFQGNYSDNCYHCNEGGHLLCCDLCPNVQHHECCDPRLTPKAKLDHWLCDSCVNDIDNFDEEAEFEDVDVDDDDDDEDFT